MTARIDVRTTDLITSALERSGLSLRQFAAQLGTSPARMSAYTHGHTTPSATLMLRMLDIAGVDLGFRARRLSVTATSRAIDEDAEANPSDAFRWLMEGRDHLLEMTPLEADLKWGRADRLPSDRRWATLLKAVAASAFWQRGDIPPPWTTGQPLPTRWQPLPRLPVRPQDADPGLGWWNIAVRTKDLTTR